MDTLSGNDLVLRPTWPVPQLGSGRTAYGIPLMMVTGALLIFTATRWVALGMPELDPELSWIVLCLVAAGAATVLAFRFDGITITANRERLVVSRWLRDRVIVSVTDLAAIQLHTEQTTWRGRKIDHPTVCFITHDGQCVVSLDWGHFTDDDLDQLSRVTGVRQDGGWFYKHSA